jgi:hypothetical protein
MGSKPQSLNFSGVLVASEQIRSVFTVGEHPRGAVQIRYRKAGQLMFGPAGCI